MQPWTRRLFKNPIELNSPMEYLWPKYRGNILYLKYIQRLVPASISLDNTEMYRCASQNNVHKHYLWCKLKIIIDFVLFILRYRISSCGINDIKVRTHRYLFPCDTKQREQRWARLIQMLILSQMKMIDKSSFLSIFFSNPISMMKYFYSHRCCSLNEAEWCICMSVNYPSLVLTMVRPLAGVTQLSESVMEYWSLNPWKQTSVRYISLIKLTVWALVSLVSVL